MCCFPVKTYNKDMIISEKTELLPPFGRHQILEHGRLVHAGDKDVVNQVGSVPAHLYSTVQEQDEVAVVVVTDTLVDPSACGSWKPKCGMVTPCVRKIERCFHLILKSHAV